MKYLVLSDSHQDRQIVVDVFKQWKDKVDYVIHCGDSELSSDDELWKEIHVVAGNCDYDNGYEDVKIITTPEDKILVTHGHLYGVRMGLQKLAYLAEQSHADIVLFGHTHLIGCEVVNQRLYLNPGSILLPRGPIQHRSFAIIESTPTHWKIQYYNRANQPIADLAFEFEK